VDNEGKERHELVYFPEKDQGKLKLGAKCQTMECTCTSACAFLLDSSKGQNSIYPWRLYNTIDRELLNGMAGTHNSLLTEIESTQIFAFLLIALFALRCTKFQLHCF
jgi:hypothetical protein